MGYPASMATPSMLWSTYLSGERQRRPPSILADDEVPEASHTEEMVCALAPCSIGTLYLAAIILVPSVGGLSMHAAVYATVHTRRPTNHQRANRLLFGRQSIPCRCVVCQLYECATLLVHCLMRTMKYATARL